MPWLSRDLRCRLEYWDFKATHGWTGSSTLCIRSWKGLESYITSAAGGSIGPSPNMWLVDPAYGLPFDEDEVTHEATPACFLLSCAPAPVPILRRNISTLCIHTRAACVPPSNF